MDMSPAAAAEAAVGEAFALPPRPALSREAGDVRFWRLGAATPSSPSLLSPSLSSSSPESSRGEQKPGERVGGHTTRTKRRKGMKNTKPSSELQKKDTTQRDRFALCQTGQQVVSSEPPTTAQQLLLLVIAHRHQHLCRHQVELHRFAVEKKTNNFTQKPKKHKRVS